MFSAGQIQGMDTQRHDDYYGPVYDRECRPAGGPLTNSEVRTNRLITGNECNGFVNAVEDMLNIYAFVYPDDPALHQLENSDPEIHAYQIPDSFEAMPQEMQDFFRQALVGPGNIANPFMAALGCTADTVDDVYNEQISRLIGRYRRPGETVGDEGVTGQGNEEPVEPTEPRAPRAPEEPEAEEPGHARGHGVRIVVSADAAAGAVEYGTQYDADAGVSGGQQGLVGLGGEVGYGFTGEYWRFDIAAYFRYQLAAEIEDEMGGRRRPGAMIFAGALVNAEYIWWFGEDQSWGLGPSATLRCGGQWALDDLYTQFTGSEYPSEDYNAGNPMHVGFGLGLHLFADLSDAALFELFGDFIYEAEFFPGTADDVVRVERDIPIVFNAGLGVWFDVVDLFSGSDDDEPNAEDAASADSEVAGPFPWMYF